MTSHPHKPTGVLRKWQRSGPGIRGFIHESDIWDEGQEGFLFPGKMIDCSTFYRFEMGTQWYKLPKDEEELEKNGDPSS